MESTRHIGYNNQTEKITDTTAVIKVTAPWTKGTTKGWIASSSGFTEAQEAQGAGDIGYTIDYNLINYVYKSMKANNPLGEATPYWVASRYYGYNNSQNWTFAVVKAGADGEFSHNASYYYNVNGFYSSTGVNAIRPILTLKSDIKITSGDGKSESTAYQLS